MVRTPEAAPSGSGRAERLSVLLAEYGALKAEIRQYVDYFHRQTTHVTLYLSIVASGVGVVGAWLTKVEIQAAVLRPTVSLLGTDLRVFQLAAFAFYVMVTLLGNFFVAASLSYIYLIEVLARRSAAVERNINAVTGDRLLVWDTTISPALIRSLIVHRLWFSPSAVRILWSCLVLLTIVVCQVLTARAVLGIVLGTLFWLVAGAAYGFQAVQVLLYGFGVRYVDDFINRESAVRAFASNTGSERE